MPADPPIILTLHFEAAVAARLQSLRSRHFPPALNRVPAHLTLFHQLPGNATAQIIAAVQAAAEQAPFAVSVIRPLQLGRGVALQVESPALHALHNQLRREFAGWLTAQDRQPFRPHITIQNKTTPETAAQLFAELTRELEPFAAFAEGVELWQFLGGPWSPLLLVPFAIK